MLIEIKINKVFSISDRQHYITSVYFIDTRVLVDMFVECEKTGSDMKLNKNPRTVKGDMMLRLSQERNDNDEHFSLMVNSKKLHITRRTASVIDFNNIHTHFIKGIWEKTLV